MTPTPSQAAALLGAIGGRNGTGAAKARTPEQARAAGRAGGLANRSRWQMKVERTANGKLWTIRNSTPGSYKGSSHDTRKGAVAMLRALREQERKEKAR